MRRTAQGNKILGLDFFVEAAMQECTTAIRFDQRRTARNVDCSTKSEPEKKARKTLLSVQQSESLAGEAVLFDPSVLFNVVSFREDTMPGLFRTRFVGCHAFPCNLSKLWYSTCKTYERTTEGEKRVRPKKERIQLMKDSQVDFWSAEWTYIRKVLNLGPSQYVWQCIAFLQAEIKNL